MSSFLGKIKNILNFKTRGNRRKFLSLFLLLFLIFFVTSANEAHAAFGWITDTVAAGIGSLITLVCWAMAKLFIGLTIFATNFFITIASYNDFINSKIVILGWVLVRDVVNMFFVLILLVIAFGTVLGLEQYEWKKLLVKLVFAAVLVNFSRLICGVIIDAAQVFTMTFVNGFAATAGGNVINALKLQKGWLLSTQAESAKIEDVNYLIASVATVFFSVISFFVLGAYMVIMLYRVVVLWVLIILSPIAFISSVLPATQKYATEWWKEFNNHVLAGPILAFFFWLSFAAAGSGEIYNEEFENKNFTRDEGAVTQVFSVAGASSGINELLEWPTMASFAIAIALLMVGVEKTQQLGVRGAGALSSAMSTAKKVAMTASGVAALGWGVKKTWGGIKNEAINIGGDIKDMAQLRGLAFLERSYDKEKLTGEKGFWAKRADQYMEREKLRSARKKQLDTRKGIFDSQVGTLATLEAKKETELLKYNLQQREKLKEAGMPAILQEVEGKFRQNDAHKIIIDELNTKQRQATQINKEREQLVAGERRASEEEYQKQIATATEMQMLPAMQKAAPLIKEAEEKEKKAEDLTHTLEISRSREKQEIEGYEEAIQDLLKLIEDVKADKNRPEAEKQAEIQRLEEEVYQFQDSKDYAEKYYSDQFNKDSKVKREAELESKITTLKVDAANLKAEAGKITEEGRKKAEENIAAGKVEDLDKDVTKEFTRRRGLADKGIQLEDKELIGQQEELIEKAKAYERSGELARAMAMFAAADNLANKKENEAFAGTKQNQRVAMESKLVGAIKEVQNALKKMVDINSVGYKDTQKILNKLQRQKIALSSYNSGAGGESSRDSMVACLNEVGWFDKEGEVNMDNRLRAVLSQQLGRYVGQGGEDEAKKEFRDRFTSDGEFQAAMETIADNFKKAGMSGDLTKIGLISEELDKATGKLKYAWKENPDNSAATLDYYVTRGKFDKLSTLGNINKDGILCGINSEGLKQLETIFKGKTDVNLSHKDFNTIFSSLNESSVNRNNFAQFERLITTLKSSVKQDPKVFKALEQRIKILTDKIDKAKKS